MGRTIMMLFNIPVNRKDAREMISEIRGRKVLEGARGRKAVNMTKLEELILGISRMVQKERRIQELDLNPVFADDKGMMAVDARILV